MMSTGVRAGILVPGGGDIRTMCPAGTDDECPFSTFACNPACCMAPVAVGVYIPTTLGTVSVMLGHGRGLVVPLSPVISDTQATDAGLLPSGTKPTPGYMWPTRVLRSGP